MLQRITGPIRASFLILAPACVLLGVATAYASDLSFPVLSIVLAFLGAVAAHIAVNSLNEYHDYKSGLDATTDRTPFYPARRCGAKGVSRWTFSTRIFRNWSPGAKRKATSPTTTSTITCPTKKSIPIGSTIS